MSKASRTITASFLITQRGPLALILVGCAIAFPATLAQENRPNILLAILGFGVATVWSGFWTTTQRALHTLPVSRRELGIAAWWATVLVPQLVIALFGAAWVAVLLWQDIAVSWPALATAFALLACVFVVSAVTQARWNPAYTVPVAIGYALIISRCC